MCGARSENGIPWFGGFKMQTTNTGLLLRARAYALLALTVGLVGNSQAGESGSDPAPRDFGGHLFIPSTLVPDPFISTMVATTTGGGSAVNLVVPLYNIQGQKIAETSSSIAFMQLGFDYQQAINRRVALRLAANGGGRLGTSASSVLTEGVSAVYGYGVGATINLTRKAAWQVAASADVRGNTLYGVSPLTFVRSVINSIAAHDTAGALGAAEDSLLAKESNARFLGGIRGAYTPAPWMGFTGFIEAGLGDKFTGGDGQIGVTNLGVTASFDLNPLKRIPVGLIGSFRNETLSEKGDDAGSSQAVGLAVFYTGRRFFSIGLENAWSQIRQPQTSKDIDVVQTRFVLRYDFQ